VISILDNGNYFVDDSNYTCLERCAVNSIITSQIHDIRNFNRFYTARIGILTEGLHDRPVSLTEGRVLYELAQHETTTAGEINAVLGLDVGYLSRILAGFRRRGWLQRRPSPTDGRQSLLWLTAAGHAEFDLLDAASQQEIHHLVEAIQSIRRVLGDRPATEVPYVLRQPDAGDMGWIVQRHGAVYAQEYRWNQEFESLVAEIVATFMKSFDASMERCWIAEMKGENVGCVLLAKQSETVAKLRLLLVDPKARGHGIGARLVDECIRFARRAGYVKVELWTNSVLAPARRIYERAGFRRIQEVPHHSFGHDLVAETWELEL
jgi:DNA-binding MarR family transcriptional regulator/GNAT superfamily N-acetyltransferase